MSFDAVGWPEGMAKILAFFGTFAAVVAGIYAPFVAAIAGLALGRYWYLSRNDMKGAVAMATLGMAAGLMVGAVFASNVLLTGGLLALGVAGGWIVHASGMISG